MPYPRDVASTPEVRDGEHFDPPRPHRRWLVAGIAVLGVLLLAYVAGALYAGDRVPRDTTVAGVAIGGQSAPDAAQTLERELGPRTDEPMTVSAGELTRDIVPSSAGLELDAAATVDAATRGDQWNPLHIVAVLLGGDEVAPVATVDDAALSAAVADLAADAEVEPVDGSITFADGTAQVLDPMDGVVVDAAGAAAAIEAGYLSGETVELPVETTEPLVGADEIEQAMTEFATPAMSAPVVVAAGEVRVELTPAEIGPHLTMTPEAGGSLQPAVDAAGLIESLPDRFAPLVQPPTDASFDFVDGQPTVVPGVDGTTIDAATLAASLLEVLPVEGAERVAEATVAAQEPDLTAAEAQALGVVEPISEFTTNYPVVPYRVTNIGRASDLVHETLVLPGETFSLNETIGERTVANGFVEGTVIQDGRFFESLGGGVSQLATTTFNAVFFAGLEDVEHRPHSLYIGRYPEGREATVVWPVVDLRFRNDSGHGVLIETIHTEGELTVRFWGTKVWDEIESVSSGRRNLVDYETITDDSEECIDQDGVPGFDITVTRNFIRDGAVVRSEDFVTHYNPTDDITCV